MNAIATPDSLTGVAMAFIPEFIGNSDFLNFLLPMPQSAFWWPRALYSPGHVPLDLKTMEKKQGAVLRKNRHPRALIVSDSGGYQVTTNASGPFQIDWDNQAKADGLRKKVLDWQEAVSEWGMILDIPSSTIRRDEPHPFFRRNFQKCLDVTIENIRFLVSKRSGTTKFINVIQGNSAEQADQWYGAVKDFPLEGWAFPILADKRCAGMIALRIGSFEHNMLSGIAIRVVDIANR